MRVKGIVKGIVLAVAVFATEGIAERAPGPLMISKPDGQLRVALPQEPIPPVGGTKYILQIQRSTDLRSWEPAGELAPRTDGTFVYEPPATKGFEFFQLRPRITDSGEEVDGAGLFGFQRVFDEDLRRAGFLTPEAFAAQHPPSGRFLAQISFDPRRAKYWDVFNADPAVVDPGVDDQFAGLAFL